MKTGIRTRQRGFTLIEAVAAIAIVVIVASLVTASSFPLINYYKGLQTRLELYELHTGLMRYATDFAAFPPTIEDLIAPWGGAANLLWRGPYVARAEEDYTRDAWNSPYFYAVGTSEGSGTEVAVILSTAKNRIPETERHRFTELLWNVGGDDLALRPTMQGLHWETLLLTRHTLRVVRGIIMESSPNTAPEVFDVTAYRDGWNTPIRYLRCNQFGAVAYSVGMNRVDESLGGATLCAGPQPVAVDDYYIYITWERTALGG